MKFKSNTNIALLSLLAISLITPPATSITNDCSTKGSNTAKVCQVTVSKSKTKQKTNEGNKSTSNSSYNDFQYTYSTVSHGNGVKVTYANENHNIMSCETVDGRRGTFKFTNMSLESGIPVDHGTPRSPSSASCIPDDTRTLTSADSPGPTGPTYEEIMEEIRHAAESLEPGKPTLHQSYNNPAGTGRAEGDPNVYKGDQVNFYAEAPTAYWEGELSAGHVEIESYPVQMTVQYGNGNEGSFYTIGEPIYPTSGSKARPTATSYVYKRSGNFHTKRSTPTQ